MEIKEIIKILVGIVLLIPTTKIYAEEYIFNSYHIYTTDEDKYSESNICNDSSKVCIDEVNQEIELYLYNREAGKWMPFGMKINHKIDLGIKAKIGTLYMCTNNANQPCSMCICNTEEGYSIDVHNFNVDERPLSFWGKIDY